jgi:hypothetical protein
MPVSFRSRPLGTERAESKVIRSAVSEKQKYEIVLNVVLTHWILNPIKDNSTCCFEDMNKIQRGT